MEKDTSEIEKLEERITKDPKSKLFVPLAEEYKKAGNIEMAIQVLTEGLKNNPSYVTARSFLGRLLMDSGDLAGAQKELEEVIKAIPDNLLAQRKLGDIYVLQGRTADAVQRYRAAIALNPGDKELPLLLADLSAGKDISARIPKPKVHIPGPAAPAVQAAAAPAQPKASAAAAAKPAVPAASSTEAKKPATPLQQPALQARPAAPKPASASSEPVPAAPDTVRPAAPAKAEPALATTPAPAVSSPDETEVIEEIVAVEAIEHPATAPETMTSADDILSASSAGPAPAMSEALSFDLSEAPATAPESAGEPAVPLWGEAEALDVIETAPAATAAEEGDDLNTNTLAELYISQGFYDKAIEVYQGMLGDQPESKTLQQKIAHLKSMAASQVAAMPAATPIAAGPREYTPPVEAIEEAAAPAPAEVWAEAPAQDASSVQAVPETVPPAAEQQRTMAASAEVAPVLRGPRTASARRKETIDRLESWLKNILKEKP